MKHTKMKSAMLSLFLLAGAAVSHAQTVTVGPTGQYATPCAAFPNLTNGETVQIDANGGVPYDDNTDCTISASYLTIVGVNGRAVMTGANFYTSKGLWIMNGHDNVVDNIEFGNASGAQNAAGIRIQVADGSETPGTTDGGNITVQHSYVHNNGTGILGANANQYGSGLNWYSANPYITFQYDEFAYNGNLDAQGNTHNMYMGYGGNMDFTLQYSWTHDSFVGHTVKTRAPYNNILYNLDTDASGTSSYLLDFCLGGSNYVVGNVLYKGAVTNGNTSQNWFIYADDAEDTDGPEYPPANQDLHFINNTVVDDPSNGYPPQFISMSCGNSTQSSCPAPNGGSPAESVPAVIENNIFVGPAGNAITNQNGQGGGPTAYVKNNVVQTYSASQLAADFVDWAHYDFHLAAGSPAIGAGLYPPTNNAGASDPKALAAYEPVVPTGAVARPTPSGSTMDAGAYSYPRVGTVPNPSLNYTTSVTAPGSGTITISNLPTPPSGSYNYAAFFSENTAAVPNPSSADSTTGTITATFSVNPAVTQSTVVPIDIYVMGAHLVANVTVNPGPPILSSVTQDYNYAPFSTVHLEGPAPSGGTVINLSSSNSTYLYVPSTVTVPQGQISAETGSETGSLWGQNPGAPTETITATQGSVQKSVSFGVFAPGFHNYPGPEYGSSQSGQPSLWCVVMVGFFPNGGGNIQVTSDTPSVVPNQTITSGYDGCSGNGQGQVQSFTTGVNFDGDIAIATNAVSTNTTVNVTLNLNGATATGAITLTPGGGGGAPSAPSGLGASASSSRPVNLSWTASSTSGVTYSVFRSTSSGFTPSSANQIGSNITATTYADYSVLPSTTYYYIVEAVDGGGSSGPSNQASGATQADIASATDVVAIDAGGPAASPFVADEYYTNGITYTVSNTIDTSLVTNPAPQAVYQSQRYTPGSPNFSYTIPGLTPAANYVVRLSFVEQYYTSTQAREFNVLINNVQVLTNFDTFAAAGGEFKAVALNFAATANSSGQIVINFNNGIVDNALINGIEIQQSGVSVASVTLDNGDAYKAATTVTLTGPAPAGGAVVSITSSNQNTLYAPASVTVPAGQTSAEIGTSEGALWGQSPSTKTATLTATYNGSSKSLTQAYNTPGVHGMGCDYGCTVKGGTKIGITTGFTGYPPHTPGLVYYTSSNTAVIPNQSFTAITGQYNLDSQLTTKAVTSTKTVTVTTSYNGDKWASVTVTVTP